MKAALIQGLTVLLLTTQWLLACGSGGDGGGPGGGGSGGSAGGPGGGKGVGGRPSVKPMACAAPKVQPLSASCCPEYALDACGAGLFCAAFDGRSQPTCYAERTRLDLTECSEDRQCLSGSCNATEHLCRSLAGTECDAKVGCANGARGERFVCTGLSGALSCEPVTGKDDSPCETSADCTSKLCVMGICQNGKLGSACEQNTHCESKLCVLGVCTNGSDDSPCVEDAHCTSRHCALNTCVDGEAGSFCDGQSDCETSLECAFGLCRKLKGAACCEDCDLSGEPDYVWAHQDEICGGVCACPGTCSITGTPCGRGIKGTCGPDERCFVGGCKCL